MRAVVLFVLAGCSFTPGRFSVHRDAASGDAADSSVTKDATDAMDDAMADAMADALVDAMADARPDAPNCPSDYAQLTGGQAGSVYKRYGYAQSAANVVAYAAAKQTCANDGAYVAVPDTAQEIAAFDTISQNPGQPGYWVGITDIATEGSWVTAKGVAATYLPWLAGQPNGGTGSNCVVGYQSQLYDVDCAMATYVFVCECEP